MTQFVAGDEVQEIGAGGRLGVVQAITTIYNDVQFYRVFFGGAAGSVTVAEHGLRKIIRDLGPADRVVRGMFDGYDDLVRVMITNRIRRDAPLRNNVFAFNASRTKLYPYQFKPLIKLLDSERARLLIADEVGLGKTIEAGLILSELKARQDLRTILIVCPSGLREKWQMELKTRFDEKFEILRAIDVVAWAQAAATDGTAAPLRAITSLEGLRRRAVVEALNSVGTPVDLVIIDEAHHLRNPGTLNAQVGRLLSEYAGTMLMLTATPVQLARENLFHLLSILDPEEFRDATVAEERFVANEEIVQLQRVAANPNALLPDIVERLQGLKESPWFGADPFLSVAIRDAEELAGKAPADVTVVERVGLQRSISRLNLIGHIFSRSRRREVQPNPKERRSFPLAITPSRLEREVYEQITQLVKDAGRRAGQGADAFRLQMPQRMMASSIPAMVAEFQGGWRPPQETVEREEASNGEPEDFGWLVDASSVEEVLRLWPQDGVDSKYQRLVSLLRDVWQHAPADKVIVFGFFKGTLRYLEKRLQADGVGCVRIDGDIPPNERPGLIERFRNDKAIRVMLASRVGSEGLDLQFSNRVVNYDLPWNPMEIEQRIGRIDRIGQESPVIHVYSLWVEGTIEERVLKVLYDRIGVFERSIGELDVIVGEVMKHLERDLLLNDYTAEEIARRTEEAERQVAQQELQLQQLEQETDRFVGAEVFFEQEVRDIQTKRRYITAGQLYRFTSHFIRVHAPHTRLDFDPATKLGVLHPDRELRDIVVRELAGREIPPALLSTGTPHQITFDGEVALVNPRLDLLNVHHPLIQAIVARHTHAGASMAGAYALRVVSRTVPPDVYLFRVYRVGVKGVRQFNLLVPVFAADGGKAVGGDLAEELLGQMTELGEPWLGAIPEIDPSFSQVLLDVAERLFLDGRARLQNQEELVNENLLERRLVTLDAYATRMKRKHTALAEHARDPRIVRLHEGVLRRLDAERVVRERELRERAVISLDHVEVAAGLVEVIDG